MPREYKKVQGVAAIATTLYWKGLQAIRLKLVSIYAIVC